MYKKQCVRLPLVTTYDPTVLFSHLPHDQFSIQDCIPKVLFFKGSLHGRCGGEGMPGREFFLN